MMRTVPPSSDRPRRRAAVVRTRAGVALAALALIVAACGGDDGGADANGGDDVGDRSPQAQVAAEFLGEVDADGIDVDDGCVRETTARLSDDDARALLDNDEAALSQDGTLVLVALFDCIDLDIEDFEFDTGPTVSTGD